MHSRRVNAIVSWTLGILTLIALILNRPALTAGVDKWMAAALLLLIAFTFNMGVQLTSAGEISPAHLFSILSALTLGLETALWITAGGVLLGSLLRAARAEAWGYLRRTRSRRVTPRSIETIVEEVAHQTLTLLVSVGFYTTSGGRFPLGRMGPADLRHLAILVAGYASVYLLFFALRVRLDGRALSSVLNEDRVTITGMVLLPLPFGILGAVIYNELDDLSFAILMTGLVLVVIGVYGLSWTRHRYLEQVQELTLFSAVSKVLRTSLDLQTLLETIYLQTASMLNANHFTVALIDPRSGDIQYPVVIEHGQESNLPSSPPGNTLLDYVMQHRTPLLLAENVQQEALALNCSPPGPTLTSWLGVPLLAQERVLGAIAVATSEDHVFTEADQRLLVDIATQAAMAIGNAELYERVQNRAHQLATLNNISMLLSRSLSAEKVINLVTSSLAAILDTDAVALYLNWDMGEYNLVRNVGLSMAFSQNPPVPLLLTQQFQADPETDGPQVLVISDAFADARIDNARRATMTREGKRAFLELMLTSGNQSEGVLVAYFDQPRRFTEDEIEVARTFVMQATIALKNARIYTSTDIALDQRITQLQALYDIGQQLTSTLNLDTLFARVLEYALSGTHANAGLVVIGVPDRPGVQVVAHRGYPPGVFTSPLAGASITARVYETGRPVLVEDVSQHPDYHAANPETRTQLSVPILRKGETLGVITIESTRQNAFGDNDITYVSQLANQAAIAIENARLFKELAEGRDRLQVILDSMTEGVLLVGRSGTIELANPRIESLLGVRPQRLVGQFVGQLLDEGRTFVAEALGFSVAELRLLLADLREGRWNPEHLAETHLYHLEDPQPLFIARHIAPVYDNEGMLLGLLLVFIDRTEEQELAQAREDLSRMIVHDLRSPLTAVTASLKLLYDLAPPDSEYTPIVHRTVEASNRAVRKLLNLVDSLLDIAKMESGQLKLDLKPTPLYTITDSIASQFETLAQEMEVDLVIRVPEELPLLNIDPGHIERVLLNLVDNALKFTPAGGRVTVRAYLPGESSVPQGLVRVEVADTGPGVPDEYKDRLFNRFVQIENSHGRRRGTGLGLTFCRFSVEAHGGRIWIEDNPGGGSIFAFTLPVAQHPTRAPKESENGAEDTADLL
ncbi:MAG: hypothetical protein Kow0077_19710 [Anaerolineae bacterium]